MNTITFDQIQAVGAIATAIGVLLAVWQLRESRKQAVTDFEDEFPREYRELSQRLPIQAFFGAKLTDDESKQAEPAFFNYIDLCNEQVFLRQNNRITKATWESWRGGIKSNLKLQAFQAAWEKAKEKTTSFEELRRLEREEFKTDPRDW